MLQSIFIVTCMRCLFISAYYLWLASPRCEIARSEVVFWVSDFSLPWTVPFLTHYDTLLVILSCNSSFFLWWFTENRFRLVKCSIFQQSLIQQRDILVISLITRNVHWKGIISIYILAHRSVPLVLPTCRTAASTIWRMSAPFVFLLLLLTLLLPEK